MGRWNDARRGRVIRRRRRRRMVVSVRPVPGLSDLARDGEGKGEVRCKKDKAKKR
jgi:hypothetical protein